MTESILERLAEGPELGDGGICWSRETRDRVVGQFESEG